MLFKLLLTLLLTSQILLPATTDQAGQILGTQTQEAGDRVVVAGPQRIINKNLGVKISANYAVVIDEETDKILFDKNSFEPRSIASITKLMTALVFLDTNPDLNKEIEIIQDDITGIGKMNLLLGEKVTLENLLYLSLITSDNNATLVMVRSSGMSENEFIKKMNIKAQGLDLTHTRFVDPVGIGKENVSTAYEVALLLKVAMHHALIRKILNLKNYSFTSLSNKYHQVKNTNELLVNPLFEWQVLGGKTGYIEESSYCFASLIKLRNGHEVVSVVLGAPTDTNRFQDTKAIVSWVETNFRW